MLEGFFRLLAKGTQIWIRKIHFLQQIIRIYYAMKEIKLKTSSSDVQSNLEGN